MLLRIRGSTLAWLLGSVAVALATISTASADKLDDKIKVAANAQSGELAECLGAQGYRFTSSGLAKTESPQVLADEALQKCQSWVHAIYLALIAPPAGLSLGDAETATERVVSAQRKSMIEQLTETQAGQ
jgi:hypothetical protein